MRFIRTLAITACALLALAAARGAQAEERRLALVIGEAAYPAMPIATAANDAGLVAQTLQAAGFDVTGARDLEETALKEAFRDFIDKVNTAGKDVVAFVYVSGYGVQLEGENYIVPVDAKIARDSDIPLRTLRVSDYLKPLSASGAKLTIVALDAARANPFKLAGQPIAGGLALYEPGGATLLAFNAAPGTIAPEATKDYGPYAHALAEMMRDGGRPLMEVFENTRLRVSEMTKGAQIPWNSQRVETDFVFFQREAGAPLRKEDVARLSQPISALGPDDGFSAALRRDTLQGYQDYVATYPASPYAKRARAMAAARREAMTWRRSRTMDTADAYWSYLRRYPKGPHAWDARRRLAELRYELEPPAEFAMVDYGYPPPPPDELVFVDQPVVYFADPVWDFPPPPPPPIYFLPPPPPDFIVLPPPVVFAMPYALPAPPYVPIPVWQAPPRYVAPPPNNFIFTNMHNAVVVNPVENQVIVRNRTGGVVSTEALTAAGAGAAAVGVGAALPNFIAKRNRELAPAGMAPAGMATPPGGAVGPGGERPAGLHPAGAPGNEQAPPMGAGGPPAGLSKDHALPTGPAGHETPPGGPRHGPPDTNATAPDGGAPGRERRDHRLPAGLTDDHAPPSSAGATSGEAVGRRGGRDLPGGARERPVGGADHALPTPAGGGTTSADDRSDRRKSGRGAADHALPTPSGGEPTPADDRSGGRMSGRGGAGHAPPTLGGGEAPAVDDRPDRRMSPNGRTGRPDRTQPGLPIGGDRPARLTPPGGETGGPPNALDGDGRGPRNGRRAYPQGLDMDGGFSGPPGGRMRGGDPMGGEMRAPARMRPPPMDAPDMREAPAGMGSPLRGMRHDPMPPRPEPMSEPQYQGGGYRGGPPPQMREMGQPAMRAPAMERPQPPPGMAPGRPAYPEPAAQPRQRDEGSRHHDGDGGGPPGFGGMR